LFTAVAEASSPGDKSTTTSKRVVDFETSEKGGRELVGWASKETCRAKKAVYQSLEEGLRSA